MLNSHLSSQNRKPNRVASKSSYGSGVPNLLRVEEQLRVGPIP